MLAIEIHELSKSYPGVEALKKVSFSVQKGSIHGFLGPNGAGKSTTMKILGGLIKATSGRVKIFDQEMTHENKKNLEWVKTQVGLLPEQAPLYMDMIVKDYLHFTAGIHGVKRKLIPSYINEVIKKTGLAGVEKRLIGNLSKGFQQRVGLAQALVFKPRILILDEPTIGLDPASIIEIRQLICELKGEHTILLSTHQLHEVTQSCSDITIINQGKIMLTGSMELVQQQFNAKQVITAEVAHLQEALISNLQKIPFVDYLQVEDSGPSIKKLIFHINEKKDQRAFVGQYLVEKGCQLLSLSKQNLQLEDIFLQVTQRTQDLRPVTRL